MFFEGAPRLLDADVTIPGLRQGDPNRFVVEAYPGVLARQVIGRRPYKQDMKKMQTPQQHRARLDLLTYILNGGLYDCYGIHVNAPMSLVHDPSADTLDTLLCAIQAAWAWGQRESSFGAPASFDLLEGWIADPSIRARL